MEDKNFFEDSILSEIKCSQCQLAPYPYVQFCKAGHVICQRCSSSCHSCPRKTELLEICSEPIIPISLQSSLHQKILSHSNLLVTREADRELVAGADDEVLDSPPQRRESTPIPSCSKDTCFFSTAQSQVVMAGKCPFEACDYLSLMEDNLLSHITTFHQVATVSESDAEIETKWNIKGRKILVILSCYEQHFMLLASEHQGELLYIWVSQINGVEPNDAEEFRVQLRLQKPSIENTSVERACGIETVMNPSRGLYEPDENCLVLKKAYVEKNLSAFLTSSDDLPTSEPASSIFINIISARNNPVPCTPSSCNAEKLLGANNDYPPVERSLLSSPLWEPFEETSSAEFRRNLDRHGFVNPRYPNFVLKPPESPTLLPPLSEFENPDLAKPSSFSNVEEPWPVPIQNPIFQPQNETNGKVIFLPHMQGQDYYIQQESPEPEQDGAPSSEGTRSITPKHLEMEQKAQNLYEERKMMLPERKICIKGLNIGLRKPMPPPQPAPTKVQSADRETLAAPSCEPDNQKDEDMLPTPADSKTEPAPPGEQSVDPEREELLRELESIHFPTRLGKVPEKDKNPEDCESLPLECRPKEKTENVQTPTTKSSSFTTVDSPILEELGLDSFEFSMGVGSAENPCNMNRIGTQTLFGEEKKGDKKKISVVRYTSGLIKST